MKKVFLGGTCNNSKWRDDLIKKLKVPYFNPVVDDWNEESQKREEIEKKNSQHNLYVITPLMTGVFSIAEAVDDSNKFPQKTLFCVLEKDEDKEFEKFQIKSLNSVKKMIKENKGKVFDSLDEIADYLNNYEEITKMKKLSGTE